MSSVLKLENGEKITLGDDSTTDYSVLSFDGTDLDVTIYGGGVLNVTPALAGGASDRITDGARSFIIADATDDVLADTDVTLSIGSAANRILTSFSKNVVALGGPGSPTITLAAANYGKAVVGGGTDNTTLRADGFGIASGYAYSKNTESAALHQGFGGNTLGVAYNSSTYSGSTASLYSVNGGLSVGSVANGKIIGDGTGQLAYLSSASGSFSCGYLRNTGTSKEAILTSAAGSISGGSVYMNATSSDTGKISSNTGSLAFGSILGAIGDAYINSAYGALAFGYVYSQLYKSEIQSTGKGAFAGGYCNANTSAKKIESTGKGSLLLVILVTPIS